MKTLLTIALLCSVVFACRAQDEYTIVGKVLEDGTVQLDVSKTNLLHAIASIHPIPEEHYPIWYQVKISKGPRRYLVGEVDTFIIALECEQVGDNVILLPQGITHIGRPDGCLNPEFVFSDDGEILGCTCADKLYKGPRRICNHSITRPQSDIIAAIEKERRSTE